MQTSDPRAGSLNYNSYTYTHTHTPGLWSQPTRPARVEEGHEAHEGEAHAPTWTVYDAGHMPDT